jgi:hypothetical protein
MSQNFFLCYLGYQKGGATTFTITTLSIMPFSITTLCIKGLFKTLSINDTQHKLYPA